MSFSQFTRAALLAAAFLLVLPTNGRAQDTRVVNEPVIPPACAILFLVTDLSVDGADNGLRIKSNASRGGLVTNVTYDDVCIRNTKEPIFMDTHYTASAETTGTRVPVFTPILLRNVRIVDGGKTTFDGYDNARRMELTLDNVVTDAIGKTTVTSRFVDVRVATGGTHLRIEGESVRVTQSAGSGAPMPCAAKFVPFVGR